MTAIIRACYNRDLDLRNTGVTCNKAMGATAMLIAVPPDVTFTDEDLEDPVDFLKTKLHAALGSRWYIFFGNKAPIRTLTNNQEADVLVTLDDGSTHFVRYGFINRTFTTTNGGLCYAAALASFKDSGYGIIEIDKAGQMLVQDNGDGTYSALPIDFMYSPSPMLPDLKTSVYQNKFYMSYDPDNYVQNGVILTGARPFLSMMGLIDAEIQIQNVNITGNAAHAVKANGTVTITAIGADGDTIDVKVAGVTISGGSVAKTSAETTVTLLAVKIKNAINASTSTNGGYTATNLAGVITVTGSYLLGASINAVTPTATIVGTITAMFVAFSAGVTGFVTVQIRTECTNSDLVALLTTLWEITSDYSIEDRSGATFEGISAVVVTGSNVKISGAFIQSHSYNIAGAAASVLKANGIIGYDIVTGGTWAA